MGLSVYSSMQPHSTGPDPALEALVKRFEDSPAGHFVTTAAELAKDGAVAAYNFAVGDDLNKLANKDTPPLERAAAVVSLASNFIGPEGKLIGLAGKGLVRVIEHVGLDEVMHGGPEAMTKLLEHLPPDIRKQVAEQGAHGLELLDKARNIAVNAYLLGTNAKALVESGSHLPGDLQGLFQAARASVDPTSTLDLKTRIESVATAGLGVANDLVSVAPLVHGLHHAIATGERPTLGVVGRPPDAEALRDLHLRVTESGGRVEIRLQHEPLTPERLAAIKAIDAAHPEKPVVVYDHDLSSDDKRVLRQNGIDYGKTHRNADAAVDRASTPQGRFERLSGPALNAYSQHDTAQTNRYQTERAEAYRHGGVSEPGMYHREQQPWNGTTKQVGSISFVSEDGKSMQQYVGGGQWVTYDTSKLQHPLPRVGEYVAVQPGGQVVPETTPHDRTLSIGSHAGR